MSPLLQTFTQKSSLKVHIKAIHERKKDDFKCESCKATFSYKQSLDRHVVAVQDGKKTFKCVKCIYLD